MAPDDGFFGHTGNEEFDSILSLVGGQMERFEEAREELTKLRGEGKAADGQVTVEVQPTGSLSALEIKPRAMRLGSEALAEAILEAAAKATEDVSARMNEIMSSVVGRNMDVSQLLQGKLLSMNPGAEEELNDPEVKEAMARFSEMRRKYGI
jgi:DNA-binding protein YbaB